MDNLKHYIIIMARLIFMFIFACIPIMSVLMAIIWIIRVII